MLRPMIALRAGFMAIAASRTTAGPGSQSSASAICCSWPSSVAISTRVPADSMLSDGAGTGVERAHRAVPA